MPRPELSLEGYGAQPNRGRSYPETPMVDETQLFRKATLAIMRSWRRQRKPFRPKEFSEDAIAQKKAKFQEICEALSEIYRIRRPTLKFSGIGAEGWNNSGNSGGSFYNRIEHSITLVGRFSVLTFLHEFGHARGFDETDAVKWSVNLFRRTFPKSFARLRQQGHMCYRNIELREAPVGDVVG